MTAQSYNIEIRLYTNKIKTMFCFFVKIHLAGGIFNNQNFHYYFQNQISSNTLKNQLHISSDLILNYHIGHDLRHLNNNVQSPV